MRHKLNNINTENRTAICSVCGPVKINIRSLKNWRCAFKHSEIDRRRVRTKRLKLSVEFTKGDFDALLEKQNQSCAICNKKSSKKLSIDHDHTTGLVRGLLCNKCNLALGLFKDNKNYLNKAIEYLK